MAGLSPHTPIPVEIKLHGKSRLFEISFDNGDCYELSYEFLRVFSPSAEVRGHGIGQEKLQIGKRDIDILSIEPVAITPFVRYFRMATTAACTRGMFCTVSARGVTSYGRPISTAWRQPAPAVIRQNAPNCLLRPHRNVAVALDTA